MRKTKSAFVEDKKTQIKRIIHNEKYIMLPVKIIICLAAGLFLYFSEKESGPITIYRYQLGLYSISNLMFLYLLLQVGQIKLNLIAVRSAAYILSIIDSLFLCYMIYFTGGFASPLYWVYCGLMIRNAASFPAFLEQTMLNVIFALFYIWTVFFEQHDFEFIYSELFWTKIILLVVISFCGWGVFNLLRRMRAERLEREERFLRKEKYYSQEKLASEVAHELKNPLGIMNNALYVIKGRLENKGSDSLIDRQVDIIGKEIDRSDRIITDLLGYARMSDGKIEQVDVHEVIDNALSMVLKLYPQKYVRADIEKKYSENIPSLLINANQLQQAFLNILTNSIEALDGEEKYLRLSTRLEQDEKELEITFRDSGCGIKPDDLTRVFDSFFTTKKDGTGLGLSIAKNIIETYNGHIDVESRPGHGTAVRVSLPLIIFEHSEK